MRITMYDEGDKMMANLFPSQRVDLVWKEKYRDSVK